ncbi:MAG: flagellar export protein FliJ [Oscillospiraceae bacterium]|jgi:flagellar export protein FliJ|nr:flagellar export protein FliJ [Oscillospiraceae bacterium]
MKRFVFRLQRVYEYKKTVERSQKAELAEAVAALDRLMRELARLEDALMNGYGGATTIQAFEEHALWLERIRDERAELLPKIAEAEQYVEQCRNRLVQTMKELKAYDKLRAEQYAEWRAENDKSERAALEDYIAGSSNRE